MTRILAADACCAAHVATRLLEKAGVPIEKAIDPLDPAGFLRIVAQLRRALSAATRGAEAAALREALQTLDVDWRSLDGIGRARVLDAVNTAIGAVPTAALPRVSETFRIVGPRIAGESRRSSVRRFGLSIPVSLTEADRRAIEGVRRNTTAFVRDEYGARRAEYAQDARDIVGRGLEEGIGSSEIAERLGERLGAALGRGDAYWQVVAMSFANTARTGSQLGAYAQAGIQRYVFEAVMDEVTSDICRYYHGREFEVAPALAQMRAQTSAEDPESVRESNPWIREGRDADGNRILYFERGGDRTTVATIERSGVGSRDDTGSFSGGMSSSALQAEGIPYPPLHGRCRSIIEPLV